MERGDIKRINRIIGDIKEELDNLRSVLNERIITEISRFINIVRGGNQNSVVVLDAIVEKLR